MKWDFSQTNASFCHHKLKEWKSDSSSVLIITEKPITYSSINKIHIYNIKGTLEKKRKKAKQKEYLKDFCFEGDQVSLSSSFYKLKES